MTMPTGSVVVRAAPAQVLSPLRGCVVLSLVDLGVACKAWDLTVGLLGISMGLLDTPAGWLNVLRMNWTINSTGFGRVSDFLA